jgi:hypothetical protein
MEINVAPRMGRSAIWSPMAETPIFARFFGCSLPHLG